MELRRSVMDSCVSSAKTSSSVMDGRRSLSARQLRCLDCNFYLYSIKFLTGSKQCPSRLVVLFRALAIFCPRGFVLRFPVVQALHRSSPALSCAPVAGVCMNSALGITRFSPSCMSM